MKDADWAEQIKQIRKKISGSELPSVSQIAAGRRNPFKILISTIISLRTKDEVTLEASTRLFAIADSAEAIAEMEEESIADLIYPAGFYRNKARHIKKCSRIIIEKLKGKVPSTREELLSLPGVGLKTANLTLNLGFGIDAICVDTHVHRISNRLGWVAANSPDKTEGELSAILPKRFWIEINSLLVVYGRQVCTPVSPRCSTCPLSETCPKIGVTKTR